MSESVELRFYSKVDVGPHPKGCHLWVGRLHPGFGYGQFNWSKDGTRYNRGVMGAHRVAWILWYGDLKDGEWVLHRCDTPACVNPKHLFLGDAKANAQDRAKKDRGYRPVGDLAPMRMYPHLAKLVGKKTRKRAKEHPETFKRGEEHYQGKLTEDDVREIKKRYVPGMGNILAREFGVTKRMILLIKDRKSWAHVA
jgi:hypothetical protein